MFDRKEKNTSATPVLPSVLHIVPPEPFGGAQRIAIDLAQTQKKRGLAAELLATRPSARFTEAAGLAEVPCHSLSDGRFKRIREMQTHLSDFDILHLHLWAPWYPVSLRRYSGDIILHLHSGPSIKTHGLSKAGVIDAIGDRLLFRRCTRANAISHWLAEEWRKTGVTGDLPIDIVPNGIRIPPARAQRGAKPVIGVACRLAKLKGLEELMDALAAVADLLPEVSVKIAGDGPLEKELTDRAAQLTVPVTFLGHVSDMEQFWAGVDLSLFTAPREPFGLRLIEPIARGIPVVAYLNGTGSDEVIAHCRGIKGVPYGDANALASAVQDILTDQETYAKMADEGRQDCIAHYALDVMERAIAGSYERMQA